jgi:hypothetical protein
MPCPHRGFGYSAALRCGRTSPVHSIAVDLNVDGLDNLSADRPITETL